MGISIAMVGVGSFGRVFVPLFQKHPLVERIALCDINVERLKTVGEEFGIRERYDSLEAVCRTDIDAVVIITQHWLHAPQAVMAMEAGKHVYSAVPVISLSDGDEMLDWCDKVVQTSQRTGMHYMMAETSYYRPQAMYCRRQAAGGAFGEFVHAEGAYMHDIDSPECSLRIVWQMRWGDAWSMKKAGEPPMHYPTHSIGGFLSVMNTHVRKVAALGHQDPNDDWHTADTDCANVFGNESALLDLANGASAIMREYRNIGAWTFEGFSLYGTKGVFVDTFEQCRWMQKDTPLDTCPILTPEQMADPLPAEVEKAYHNAMDPGEYGGHGGSHPHLVHEVVSAVAADRVPAINAWTSVRYVAPGAVAHKSAQRDGEWMNVPDWGDAPA